MADAVVLDKPAQIDAWRFASVISQLSLELATGLRHSRGGSVLKAIQANGWTSVTGNATRRNKLLALAELLEGQPAGPVVDLARKTPRRAARKGRARHRADRDVTAWADLATPTLWEARGRLLACMEDVAVRWATGLPQGRGGDPRTSTWLQANQVEEIDAAPALAG